MAASLIKKFLRDGKAAVAVALAIMTVPMIIAAGAAVDFSRIASARTLLQASADSASVAGVNAWQMSASSTNASNVANAAWAGTAAQLSKFVTVQGIGPAGTNPTVNLACTGSSTQCGTAGGYSSATTPAPYGCPTSYKYCVEVTATATLKNSLFAYVVPSETLRVTSIATSAFPPNTISQGSFTHTSVGTGSDLSGIYAYVVPMSGTGSSATPEYGTVPAPNSSCSSSTYGPISNETNLTPVPSTTPCNFLLIGENKTGGGSGSLSFSATDPVAFTFVNFSAGNTTTKGDLDATNYTSEIYENGTYQASGFAPLLTTPGVQTCTGFWPFQKCTTGPSTTAPGPALYGECPAHNLYGSIDAYPDVNPIGDDIVPLQDSINTYSSAYEVIGYPPTHATNHDLIPFLGPVVYFNSSGVAQSSSTGSAYKVQAVCPQWPLTGTSISAQGSFPFSPTGTTAPDTETVNVYATYYPDAANIDTSYGNGIYPPPITGCTPATSATDGGVTPTADDPWWGWSPSNANDYDPGDTSVHNCTFVRVSSGGTLVTSTVGTPVPNGDTASNWQKPPFTAAYNNCALLMQDLGQNVSALPTYYTFEANSSAFPSLTGNAAGIISPGTTSSTMGMILQTGTPPTTVKPLVSDGGGTYTVTEPPAGGTTSNPPQDTSHQCYNPQANGFSSQSAVNTYQDSTGTIFTGNDIGTPLDPVERPDLGVVYCGSTPANESYALYWNDMGSWANPPRYNDDLGYSNAITEFTCPTPGSTSGGGPSTLSG